MSNTNENNLVPKFRFPEFINDGEWKVKKLEDVCEINPKVAHLPDEFVYIDLESVEKGMLLQKKIIKKEEAPSRAQRLLEDNDVVFQMVRPYQKNNYYFKKNDDYDYVASTGYAQLRAYESSMFLFQFIHTDSFVSSVLEKCTGSNYPAINSSDLSQIALEIPRNPKEQQKIAACLSSLDEVITFESQKLKVLKEHKKGLLQNLFPQAGETVPKLRFKEFADSGNWVEKSLGEVATIKSGATPLRSNELFFKGGNIHWVKTTDLNNSFIFDTEEKITKLAKARINPEGSVLVAMYGGFNQIGRTGYLKIPAATNQALSVLNTNQKEVDPLFLLLWLNAKVDLWKTFAGSSRKDPNITGNDVSKFPISFPRLPEQQKIASCLSSIDEIINAQSQKVETLKLHKKGLLQGLFPKIEN
jgi:type I restriction enzyme, S subunit